MVGDDSYIDTNLYINYEFIVRDRQSGVTVYNTAFRVTASKPELLYDVQNELRERVATEILLLFNFPVTITEVCSEMPLHE